MTYIAHSWLNILSITEYSSTPSLIQISFHRKWTQSIQIAKSRNRTINHRNTIHSPPQITTPNQIRHPITITPTEFADVSIQNPQITEFPIPILQNLFQNRISPEHEISNHNVPFHHRHYLIPPIFPILQILHILHPVVSVQCVNVHYVQSAVSMRAVYAVP